jgi:hypothetical protein
MQYTLIFADFLGFCRRYLIPFCILQKGIRYLLDQKKRGQVTLSNKVTRGFSFAYKPILYHERRSLKNEEKL